MSYRALEELAYALWEARGRPLGDDWTDWFAAEAQSRVDVKTAHVTRKRMGKSIMMFMWGYQGSFRINVEIRAKALLQEIAPTLEPEIILVGVRVPEKTDGLPVCVEPEDGEWDTTLFAKCAQRTDEIYKEHEGHNVRYGDEARTRDQPENIRKSSVKRAVREVFDAYDRAHGTTTFCSWPERIGAYHVVCVLQLNKAHFDEYPKLDAPITHGDYTLSGGFLDLVIEAQLGVCVTGQRWDAETSLYYYRARYYDRARLLAPQRPAASSAYALLFPMLSLLASAEGLFEQQMSPHVPEKTTVTNEPTPHQLARCACTPLTYSSADLHLTGEVRMGPEEGTPQH